MKIFVLKRFTIVNIAPGKEEIQDFTIGIAAFCLVPPCVVMIRFTENLIVNASERNRYKMFKISVLLLMKSYLQEHCH